MDAGDEAEDAPEESDASDDEEPMEVDSKAATSDVPMETDTTDKEKDGVSKEAATTKTEKTPAPKPVVVPSGLPQSKEELETLIKAIHQTVNDSVLPRLQRCLTAKVQT